jgi:VWFA-related protein
MKLIVAMILTFTCVIARPALIGRAQLFRSRTIGVAISVTVRDGPKIVTGLTSPDFELWDDGVPQNIVAAFAETLPLDITIALDTSYSLTDSQYARIVKASRQIIRHLRVVDRLRLVTFDRRITEIMPLRAPTESEIDHAERSRNADRGGSAVFDAIAFVLMASGDREQRHIAIVLTDGMDNSSFLTGSMLSWLGKATSTLLHVMVPEGLVAREAPALRSVRWNTVRTVAETTGGQLTVIGSDVSDRILAAIDAYRQSYVLQYQPAGVEHSGWHPVTVRVKGHKRYQIHARQGYVAE